MVGGAADRDEIVHNRPVNRRRVLWSAALGVAAPVLGGALPAAAATRPGSPIVPVPIRSTRPPILSTVVDKLRTVPIGTRQLILVTGDAYSSTYARVSTFARWYQDWHAVAANLPARIGSQGFSDSHQEGIPTTPTGMYPIGSTMYGIAANPGVRYPYHRLVSGDWWNENSGTPGYNTFQHGSDPGGASEALWQISPSYTYFAVINYNMPAVAGKGSGIFLHQYSTSAGPTAGCVSLAAADLVRVLTWLDPAAQPYILMCPEGNLSRY